MDSIWSVASALKDVVKQQTAEITASLQNTDWKSELNAFQEELKEETVEIGQKAKEVTEDLGQKTIEAAKSLPQVVDQSRRRLEQLPSATSMKAKEAAVHLQEARASISKIGQRAITNTTEIFDQFSSAIQAEMNAVAAQDAAGRSTFGTTSLPRGGPSGTADASKFSRFDADVAAMQRDSSTYCDEPEDGEDFAAWLTSFDLPAHKPDISKLLSENTFMSELQSRIVPVVVDYESFWTRYFYRLHTLTAKYAKVAALTARVGEEDEAEHVGWGDTDDEGEEEGKVGGVGPVGATADEEKGDEKEDEGVVVVENKGKDGPPSVSDIPQEEESVATTLPSPFEVVQTQEEEKAGSGGDRSSSKEKEKKGGDADGLKSGSNSSSLGLTDDEAVGGEGEGDDDDDGSDWGSVAEWE